MYYIGIDIGGTGIKAGVVKENGEIILFDRYVQSNFIHQCSKLDDPDDKLEFIAWEEDFEYNLLGLPKPDLIFFIEMPVEKSLELARARAEYKTGGQKDERTKAYLTGKMG